MKTSHSDGLINVTSELQRNRPHHVSGDRRSVLVARRTASRIEDAALTSLFRSYRVELFLDPVDLFMAREAPIKYVLLCASAGCSLLATETNIIRKQWPLAKIVVLGVAPWELEDHLYDETVAPDCSPETLTTAFQTNRLDLWDRSTGRNLPRTEPLRTPPESDPTKAQPTDLLPPPVPEPRGLPSDEKRNARSRAGWSPLALARV
jgi:hypothetical protein